MSVFVDGEFWTGMDQVLCQMLGLKIGQQISDEKKAEVEHEIGSSEAFEAAVIFLGYRDRSEKELRDKLRSKEYGEGVINEVMQRLESCGYVDDRDFAREVLASQQIKGKGRRAAQVKLRQLGVADEIVEEALQEAYPEADELATAVAWLKSRRLDLSDRDQQQRVIRRLVARGFSYQTAREALDQLTA